METLKQLIQRKFRSITKNFSHSKENLGFHKLRDFYSDFLERNVKVNIYLPPSYKAASLERYPILIFNDGQDMEAMRLAETLRHLYRENKLQEIIVAAVHAGDRMQEFGVSKSSDYKGRGNKADKYKEFITQELLPFIQSNYRCLSNARYTAIAGMSLGGLSAMDIGWANPGKFSKIGVFSGAFWWRSSPFNHQDPDADRMMHDIISSSSKKDGMKFWLQTGTLDEESDRNNNGVIDSIDDTLDIIKSLENLGYNQETDIKYVELEGGRHNQVTWGHALPWFLLWSYGK